VSALIEGQKAAGFAVELTCRTLGVSPSAHYERRSGALSRRRIEDAVLVERIREIHAANYYCYGYRRTWLALKRAGVAVGRDRVKRLMRAHGIQGAKPCGKPWRTTIADPAAERRPDLVQRQFTATAPDRLWVADFTYLRCWEGLVFFSFVIDVYSRRIVGWQLAPHMAPRSCSTRCGWRSPSPSRALRSHSCITPMPAANPNFAFPQVLDGHGVLASIGSVGDALDNALAESFVDSFKTELIADRVWRTRTQLELAVVEYIGWFNHDRLHEALGDTPPAEFENSTLMSHGSREPAAPAHT
jgi:putative transposase